MKRIVILTAACCLLILGLMGCSGAATAVSHDTLLAQIPSLYSDGARQASHTFVGPVADSDFFVGLVVQGETVVAYLCNGEDVGDWLRGTAVDGQFEVSSSGGTTLTGSLNDDAISGTVLVGGERPFAFTATPAQEGISGFYRHTETVNGTNVVAGWVILENGIRGTSSDGKGIAIRDTITGKTEEGGGASNSSSGSNAVDTKGLEERPEDFITPGASEGGEEVTTLGEAPPPSCETTREGCGGPTVSCDALRGELANAERALGDLERELAQNGVQNLRDHPGAVAARRAVSGTGDQLRSSGC
jgi:hypothetical protein